MMVCNGIFEKMYEFDGTLLFRNACVFYWKNLLYYKFCLKCTEKINSSFVNDRQGFKCVLFRRSMIGSISTKPGCFAGYPVAG